MILSTQISRLDGLMLCASVDEEQDEQALSEVKSQARQVLRKLGKNSEPQASIEARDHTVQWVFVFFVCCLSLGSSDLVV